MAENYGWVVESGDVYEAYAFACDALEKENVDDAIVSCLSSDELAEILAYLFRMWDFKEYYDEYEED